MSYTIDNLGNIRMYRGDYAEIPFTMKDDDDNPVDLTNAYIYFTAKRALGTEEGIELQTITTQHTNAILGQSKIIITKEKSDIPVHKYFAEIRIDFDAIPDPEQAKPNRLKKLFLIIEEGVS